VSGAVEPAARIWVERCRLTPRIGRNLAVSRPASASTGLFACCSTVSRGASKRLVQDRRIGRDTPDARVPGQDHMRTILPGRPDSPENKTVICSPERIRTAATALRGLLQRS
jgi:hypothetical protein